MNIKQRTDNILELTAAIADDMKVVEQLAADFNDCAECEDPISIDDLNKMVAFCNSVQSLTSEMLEQVDKLRP